MSISPDCSEILVSDYNEYTSHTIVYTISISFLMNNDPVKREIFRTHDKISGAAFTYPNKFRNKIEK